MKAFLYTIAFSIIFGAVIIAAVILSGAARAETTLEHDAKLYCQNLDYNSETHGGVNGITDQGITNVIHGMFADGLDADTAANTALYGLSNYCPEWEQAITDYYAEFNRGDFRVTDDWQVVYAEPARTFAA